MAPRLDFTFYAAFGLAFALLFYAVGPANVLSGLVVGTEVFNQPASWQDGELGLADSNFGSSDSNSITGFATAKEAAPATAAAKASQTVVEPAAAAPSSATTATSTTTNYVATTNPAISLYNFNKLGVSVENDVGSGSDVANFVKSFEGRLVGGKDITIRPSIDQTQGLYSQVYLINKDVVVKTGCPIGTDPSVQVTQRPANAPAGPAAGTATAADQCAAQRVKSKELLGYFLDETRDVSGTLKDCKFLPSEANNACMICSQDATKCPPPAAPTGGQGAPGVPAPAPNIGVPGGSTTSIPKGRVDCPQFKVTFKPEQGSFSSSQKLFQFNSVLQPVSTQSPLPWEQASLRLTIALYPLTELNGRYSSGDALFFSFCSKPDGFGDDKDKANCKPLPDSAITGAIQDKTVDLDKLGVKIEKVNSEQAYKFSATVGGSEKSFTVSDKNAVRVKIFMRQWITQAGGQRVYCSTRVEKGKDNQEVTQGEAKDFKLAGLKPSDAGTGGSKPTPSNSNECKAVGGTCYNTLDPAQVAKCPGADKNYPNGANLFVSNLCPKPQPLEVRCCVTKQAVTTYKLKVKPQEVNAQIIVGKGGGAPSQSPQVGTKPAPDPYQAKYPNNDQGCTDLGGTCEDLSTTKACSDSSQVAVKHYCRVGETSDTAKNPDRVCCITREKLKEFKFDLYEKQTFATPGIVAEFNGEPKTYTQVTCARFNAFKESFRHGFCDVLEKGKLCVWNAAEKKCDAASSPDTSTKYCVLNIGGKINDILFDGYVDLQKIRYSCKFTDNTCGCNPKLKDWFSTS